MKYRDFLCVRPLVLLKPDVNYETALYDFNDHATTAENFRFHESVDSVDARIELASALNDFRLAHRVEHASDKELFLLEYKFNVFKVAARFRMNSEHMQGFEKWLDKYGYYAQRLTEVENNALDANKK